MKLFHAAALASLLALFATGCGGGYTCEDACKAGNACPGASQSDCAKVCGQIATFNTASGCGVKWDAVLSCADKNQSSACASGSSTICQAETKVYIDCLSAFCTAHSSDTNCK